MITEISCPGCRIRFADDILVLPKLHHGSDGVDSVLSGTLINPRRFAVGNLWLEGC